MKRRIALAFLAAGLAVGLAAGLGGCDVAGGDLRIEDAIYRAPLGATDIGVAYFTIRSPKADRIVAVSSVAAEAVEMHGSVMTGTTATMEHVDSVELPAGKDVIFGQGGMHLMVFSPRPVPAGGSFPITIQLESGRKETIEFNTGG